MKRSATLLIRIKNELEVELKGISRFKEEYSNIPQDEKSYLLRAKASVFHDFYMAVERIFKKIADEFNGGIPRSEDWHKILLLDMTLDLKPIRPPVISSELYERLYQFLKFRHLFRNIYGYELKADKLSEVEKIFVRTSEDFSESIEKFSAWLIEQTDI